jgi:hypothetical protein
MSRFTAVARGPDGAVSTEGATWSSLDPSIVTVDGRGEARGAGEGSTEIVVELGGITASADVEVWIPARVPRYEPGVSYFGRREYVEYIPGRLPVVLSAGHGGRLLPDEIPARRVRSFATETRSSSPSRYERRSWSRPATRRTS